LLGAAEGASRGIPSVGCGEVVTLVDAVGSAVDIMGRDVLGIWEGLSEMGDVGIAVKVVFGDIVEPQPGTTGQDTVTG